LSEPLDVCDNVFMVGGAYGCMKACYWGRDVEGGCCGVYICVGITLCCSEEVYVVGWVTIIMWAKNVYVGSHMPTKSCSLISDICTYVLIL
jgi:hypothetical protein